MTALPFVELVIQRAAGDCGIAALAMFLNQSYETVFAATITKKCKTPHLTGMYTRQLQRAARRFGTTLVLKRTWDVETVCGLLTLDKVDKQPDDFPQHLVLLKWGLVFDPADGTIWELDDYCEQQKFRPVSILVSDDKEDA